MYVLVFACMGWPEISLRCDFSAAIHRVFRAGISHHWDPELTG